jgi:CRP-like cAMP-binding protein
MEQRVEQERLQECRSEVERPMLTLSGRSTLKTNSIDHRHHQQFLSMGRGKSIPESTQWIIIRLASAMSIEDITMYTDVSPSSVRRILAHFRATEDVIKLKRSKMQTTLALCDLDIQVWNILS